MDKDAHKNFIIGSLIGAIAVFVSGMLVLLYCICIHIQHDDLSDLDVDFTSNPNVEIEDEVPEEI